MRRSGKIAIGIGAGVGVVGLWELGWWFRRRRLRGKVYREAAAEAVRLGRPLLVVGPPDTGATAGYGCGDLSVDIQPSACPRHVQADITKKLIFDSNSVVVFVSCVLEYVDNLEAAMAELCRVSGNRIYVVRVEPWTLTSFFYPGTRRRLASGTACKGLPK